MFKKRMALFLALILLMTGGIGGFFISWAFHSGSPVNDVLSEMAVREVKEVGDSEYIEIGLMNKDENGRLVRSGIWISFINDQLYGAMQFKGGIAHGQAILYYPKVDGGGVQLSYFCDNGLGEGGQQFFDQSGAWTRTVMLHNGKKIE